MITLELCPYCKSQLLVAVDQNRYLVHSHREWDNLIHAFEPGFDISHDAFITLSTADHLEGLPLDNPAGWNASVTLADFRTRGQVHEPILDKLGASRVKELGFPARLNVNDCSKRSFSSSAA